MSVAREYANVNVHDQFVDYDNLIIKWSSQENYEIIKKVGRGKYSEVFHGIDIQKNEFVIIKALKPIKKKKIQREISILQVLSGGENIIQLLDIVRDPIVYIY